MDLLTKEEREALCRYEADEYGHLGKAKQFDDWRILAAALVRLAPFLEAAGPVVKEVAYWNDYMLDPDDPEDWIIRLRSPQLKFVDVANVRALVASVPVHEHKGG